MSQSVELLAPAGDAECLSFAFQYGADAAYIGAKEFGMRAASANFSPEEMAEAAALAHKLHKKVYLTMNTTPTNQEVERLPQALTTARESGVDALIVADLGVLKLAEKYAPGVEIHFSTQVGIMNYAAATAAYEMGAKRVVLARELSLEDIGQIRAKTPKELELEAFVHGAMCMSYSGRCLLSNYMIGRDSNRGTCAQPCRWKYKLVEEKRPGQYFDIGSDQDGSYIMSADDLCTLEFLDRIVGAGVSSLKIEGRAKSFYYVASTVAAYRSGLNAALTSPQGAYQAPAFALQEISRTSHRPYSSGFFLGPQGASQSPHQQGYIREWQPVAVVLEQKDGRIYCQQRGKFVLGDRLEVLLPSGETHSFTPDRIWEKDDTPTDATPRTKMEFSLPALEGLEIPPQSILRMQLP